MIQQFIEAVNVGYTWGITLGVAATAAFLAISLIAWLFTKV